MKFRGAGQGPKALVAEIARRRARAGARAAGARARPRRRSTRRSATPSPTPRSRTCIKASARARTSGWTSCRARWPSTRRPRGGSIPALAADVVWLDALVMNVDRTPRNPNLLDLARAAVAHRPRRGAVRPARHDRPRRPRPGAPFAAIGDHVLLPHAGSILEADERLAARAARRSTRSSRWCRRSGWATAAGAVRRVPARAARRAARVRRGGRACPRRLTRAVPVRAAARRAARRARRGDQRRRRRVLPAAQVPRGARRARRGAAATRWRPAPTPRRSASGSTCSCRVAAGDADGRADRRAGRSPSASTGSPRRRARSSSPGRSTPGCATTRRRCSTGCSRSSSRCPTCTACGASYERGGADRGRRSRRRGSSSSSAGSPRPTARSAASATR